MEFNVLGPVEVKAGERIFELRPRMHRALLAVLLIHANRVVSVDRVVDALWGETPPPTATNALQGYVAGLRRTLEPERVPRSAPRLLITQSPGYVLRVEPNALDAIRFETAATEGRTLLADGRPSQACETLLAGLALWRGAPYADLSFESFVQAEVGRLTELHATASEDLAEARLAVGELPLADLEALIHAEPLRERRWQMLMLALYRSGRQADALRAFSQARRTLAEELGIEPTHALRELEGDILRQAPELDWRPPTRGTGSVVAKVGPDPAAPRPLAGETSPFVGRIQERGLLERALDGAFGGRGNVVLVAGEPGIGKTRLAAELATKASARAAAVAWGRCVEGEGAPAFWPWTQVLRALLARPEADVARPMLGPSAGELVPLVPELREASAGPDGNDGLDPEKARFRLYDVLSRFLRELTAHVPVVIILDDLHWADPASLQLLRFVAMELGGTRLLLVATCRDSEATSSPEFLAALADLGRAGASRVGLSGLDRAEVGQLFEASIGTFPTEHLVEALWDRTGGNPFFVAQLMTLLGEKRPFEMALAKELPTGVRDVIRHRVALLPDDVAPVLTVAAVIGREFELRTLAAATRRDDESVLRAIEAALRARLVGEAPEVVGRYRFVHALVTETLYDELSTMRRARLHARVGEALEQAGVTDCVPLAHHFWRGVPAGTGDKALQYAVAAAEQARARLAYEEAEDHLRRALDVLETFPAGDDRSRRELDVQTRLWVLLAPLRGYADVEAARRAERARELCLELGETRQLRGPLWGLWVFHTIRAEFDLAESCAREMLTSQGDQGDPLFLVAAQHGLGIVAMHRGELAAARDHLETAVSVADTLPEQNMVAAFGYHPRAIYRSNLATALALLGEGPAARRTAQEAQALAARDGHPYTTAIARFFEAWTAVHLSDVELARRCAEQAIVAFEAGGFRMWPAAAGVIHGWAVALQGSAEAGAEEAGVALLAWEDAGARAFRPFLQRLLAEALWSAGRPHDALALVVEALETAAVTGDRFSEHELRRLHGELSRQLAQARA